MKFLALAVVAISASVATVSAADCDFAVLQKLLTNPNLPTCSDESGYSFAPPTKPSETQLDAMCASQACNALLADVNAMGIEECTVPLGDKIALRADLIDYAANHCSNKPTDGPTDTPAPTDDGSDPTPAPTDDGSDPTPAPTSNNPAC